MQGIIKILGWIFDPKNRSLLIGGIIVALIMLNLSNCSRVSGLKTELVQTKNENTRIVNNYQASQDSLKQYINQNGVLVGEIQGYELTVTELEQEYASLLGDYKNLEDKPPITITEVVTIIKEVVKEVEITNEGDSTGGSLAFLDSTFYSEGNWRKLKGNISYSLDTNLENPVVPGTGDFELYQSLSLSTYLLKDKETGKILINVETPYPGVKFSKIEGASILDNKVNKKVLRETRKEWGLGVLLGYGVAINPGTNSYAIGPMFGVGVSYTPKILQWGK
jgi:hypothetical protein